MKVRRTLTVLAAVCLTSFALVAASAQAAPSVFQLGQHGGAAPLAKKVKGAKAYNLFYDPYIEEAFQGYHEEPPFLVFAKTHTWGLEVEPGVGETYGSYETTKVKIKDGKETIKYSYTVFNFNDVGENAELIGLDGKNSYYDGEFYREGEYAGAWYAEKP